MPYCTKSIAEQANTYVTQTLLNSSEFDKFKTHTNGSNCTQRMYHAINMLKNPLMHPTVNKSNPRAKVLFPIIQLPILHFGQSRRSKRPLNKLLLKQQEEEVLRLIPDCMN